MIEHALAILVLCAALLVVIGAIALLAHTFVVVGRGTSALANAVLHVTQVARVEVPTAEGQDADADESQPRLPRVQMAGLTESDLVAGVKPRDARVSDIDTTFESDTPPTGRTSLYNTVSGAR